MSLAVAYGCGHRQPSQGEASLWFSYGGRNREVLEKLIRRFNQSSRRHRILGVFQGDYYEGLAKLRLGIAAKAGPSFSHVIGEVIPYLVEAGVVEPLAGYPGAAELDLIPELGQAKSWRGGDKRELVALPFNRSTPIAYVNGRIFGEAGLSPPRTWAELRAVARELTVRARGGATRYGFECPISWWFWVALVAQAGGDVVEADGTVSLGGEAGVRALEFWQTLVSDDRTMKPPVGEDSHAMEATNNDFLAERVPMVWTSTAFLKYFEDHARFPVIAAPLPADRRAGTPTGGTHFLILKGAPEREKEAAWSFLRWMLEPEQVIEWSVSTGYLPTTRAAVRRLEKEGFYRSNPNYRVALDQLAVARPWPWSPDLFRIERETVQPLLETAVLRGASAGKLLAEARASLRG